MNVSRASGDTEGLEKFRAVTEKIQVIMDAFSKENPQMTPVMLDTRIGDPIEGFGSRRYAAHSITIIFAERIEVKH